MSDASSFVIPAKAGTHLPTAEPLRGRRRWTPAFAGVTAFVLLLFFLALPATAQTFPKLTGRVVDNADLLSPADEAELTAELQALEQRSSRQLVVATVPSLQGYEIEDYGYRLGRAWGIGQKEADNGAILLVAPNERRVRVEVGYGLEPILTDAFSNRVIDETILPRFKAGDMAGGIKAGVDALIAQLQAPPEVAERAAIEAAQARTQQRSQSDGFNPAPLVFWGMIILFVMLSFGRRGHGRRYRGRRRRRGFDSGDAAILLWGLDALSRGSRHGGGWGGGGGFGGFGGGGGFGGFSGGGGSFGGGGASGSW